MLEALLESSRVGGSKPPRSPEYKSSHHVLQLERKRLYS